MTSQITWIFLSLKALCSAYTGSHIQVQCDNTTAVCYINNMGGSKSSPCNAITKQIWALCITQSNWLSATHLPGCENVEADAESRIFNDRTEWMLDPQVFKGITQKFGNPEIYLFASRLNKQCAKYASWRPDPEALFVDAFWVKWNNLFFYAFPPFSLIGRCLEKVHANKAGHPGCTSVAKSKLVPETSQASGGATNCHPSQEESVSAAGDKTATPTTGETNTVGMSLVRNLYEERGFSETTTDIIMLSWRDSSRKQYDVHIRKWLYSAVQGKLIQFMQI